MEKLENMATIRILSAEKKANETTEQVTALLENAYPDWRVENVIESNGEWQARLVQDKISTSKRKVVADAPPWLKKKDDGGSDDSDSDSDDSSSDDADDDDSSEDDSSEEDKGDDKGSDGKEKGKGKGDPVKEVQKVIDELTSLLTDLGGKTQELQNAHDEKADKLKDIADTVGPDSDGPGPLPGLDDLGPDGPGGAKTPGEIGPTPGGGPAGIPPIPKRPGVPTGDAPMPGRPSAFGHRTEIAHHSGFDPSGNRISLVAAATQLEADPAFKAYEVVDIKEENGQYIAKLQVK